MSSIASASLRRDGSFVDDAVDGHRRGALVTGVV